MSSLIVLENPRDLPLHVPGAEVVAAKRYLLDPRYSDMRGAKVFNLCKSYRYQSVGYYVSLLAAARGHKPLPGITTIQDLKLAPLVGIISRDLDDLIQWSLAPIRTRHFVLSVYFGENMARRHARLSQALFNQWSAPFLRAEFNLDGKWTLEDVHAIAASEIPPAHREFVLARAQEYFSRPMRRSRPRASYRFDLAILYNPDSPEKPSTHRAIRRFVKAAKAVGLNPEIIGKDDAGRIAEFDGLFIRETTYVNHHTFRFSRRAAAEGLVVIDDPESILKCTNKVYLAELFDHHGIPSPRTMVVHGSNIDEVAAKIGLPCVIKRPDSSFSQGVMKVETRAELDEALRTFLERSDLAIAQEFTPSAFDWRVGVLDRRPLYCCKYHMARGHWQIVAQDRKGERQFGDVETIPLERAPVDVLALGLRVANLIGDGLYGVDIKEIDGRLYVMEINDNPSIDAGYEDSALKEELYLRIMRVFLERIEGARKEGAVNVMSADSGGPLRLFEATGVEIEHMIVDRETLAVRPIADALLKAQGGAYDDAQHGEITWSNELALHVVEMKTTEPAPSLRGLSQRFEASVARMNDLLRPMGAMTMPTAMHPWMDPAAEMRLWPHEQSAVYEAFDRIFSTSGHGWANLQSMHVNLPFGSDEEFGRLHAAIRLVLPILPALAASSPLVDGRLTGLMDSRLDVYRGNSRRIPSVAGLVIPEPVFTRADYERVILQRIYDDLAPHDPDGVLRYEWANARGCIARFDRSAIEIRVIDAQECPRADIAIAAAATGVIRALVEGELSDQEAQRAWGVEPLAEIFLATMKSAGETLITDARYLETMGRRPSRSGAPVRCTAAELWQGLIERTLIAEAGWTEWAPALGTIIAEGALARRIAAALKGDTRRQRIEEVYRELCRRLAEGRMFSGA